jgi:hypothetical protein
VLDQVAIAASIAASCSAVALGCAWTAIVRLV